MYDHVIAKNVMAEKDNKYRTVTVICNLSLSGERYPWNNINAAERTNFLVKCLCSTLFTI